MCEILATSNVAESSWVSFIALVRFDDKDGQKIQCLYPPRQESASSITFIQDLKMLCMPDCLESDAIHELYFMTRIRQKTVDLQTIDEMMNCYVSFRQYPDPASRRGYFQQSLVVVSKLPYLTLFNRILHRLVDVLSDIPQFEKYDHLSESEMKANDSSYLPYDLTILDSTIEVAYQHFLQWPEPCVGKTLQLPFYGIMIQYEVPIIPIYSLRQPELRDLWSLQNLLAKHAGVDGHGGLYHTINLVAVFHRLGLLPHLWTLWELVISGKNVVIWSSSAAISSAVVNALVSLIAPLAYGGDFRPYINPYDSDSSLIGNLISQNLDKKSGGKTNISFQVHHDNDGYSIFDGPHYIKSVGSSDKPTSVIVGITNPFLLKNYAQADAALFIPNPDAVKTSSISSSKSRPPKPPKIGSLFRSALFHSSSDKPHTSTVSSPSSTTASPPMKCKPSRKFSALGIGVGLAIDDTYDHSTSEHTRSPQSSIHHVSSQPTSPSNSKTIFTVKTKKLHAGESIGDAYDGWIGSGGLKVHGHHRHVLLCYRQKPLLNIDPDVDSRLSALLSSSTSLPHDVQSRLQANHVINIQASRDSITDEPSDKEVIANMMLREHFRNLTIAMLKPFDKFFHANRQINIPSASSSSSSASYSGKKSSTMTISSSSAVATSSPTTELISSMLSSMTTSASTSSLSIGSTRAGASSMLLYSNPNQFFGVDDVEVAVAEYKRNAELFGYNHIPACLRRCAEWDMILLTFANSDNFRAWSSWRRDLLVIRMLVDTSRLCQDISTMDLIQAYMIEQGCEVITKKQIHELIRRVKATIHALQQVHDKFHDIAAILFSQPIITSSASSASSSTHTTEDDVMPVSLDILHITYLMQQHLQDLINIAESNQQSSSIRSCSLPIVLDGRDV